MADKLNRLDLGFVSGGDSGERSLFPVSLIVLLVRAVADTQVNR